MNIGFCTNNKELGLDDEKVVSLVSDILGLFDKYDCSAIEVGAAVALVQEFTMEQGCLLAVTPKVRAKLADSVFIGGE